MRTCPQCAAALPSDAAWCTLCYLPIAAQEPVLAGVGASTGTASAPNDLSAFPPPPGWPPPLLPPPLGAPLMPSAALLGNDRSGRLLGRRAAIMVALAIGLGGLVQLIALALSHISGIEPSTLLRYDLVLTLGLYAGVAAMVVSQITPSVRLWWGDGPGATRIAIGAGIGGVLSGTLLLLVSAGAGHLDPDPRIVMMMSEGDVAHVVLTAFISCLAAPLVEETLFRGLLLESLRPRGRRYALVVSAFAFAAWHLMPAALIYYTAMGFVLGRIYLKRGLAASIAAHVAFNGVLVVAAIAVVLGPSHTFTVNGLTLRAPSGWSQHTTSNPLLGLPERLDGPSGSMLEVVAGPDGEIIQPAVLAEDLREDRLPFSTDVVVDRSTVRELTLPVGVADEVDVSYDGYDGELVFVPESTRTYGLLFMGGGSEKATSDFSSILDSIHRQ